jgi:ankyrin repeat protein
LGLLDEDPELVHARGASEKTLLHEAAEVDAAEAARTLLDRGSSLEARCEWGHTPFQWAATMGSRRVATVLLDRGAAGLNLWTAASLGDLETVAASFQGTEPVPGSAQARLTVAPPDQWPADTAYRRGDVVSDAFYAAARNGHLQVARLLAEKGAQIDATGFFGASGLHWAALGGHEEMVTWLVEQGAALTARDPRFGATPRSWAEEGGHAEIAELLAAEERRGGERG